MNTKSHFSPKTGINLWPGSTCLVSELAYEFSQIDKFSYPDIFLVFPTQRLEVYFLAALAKKVPAFPKPKVFSFENFVENFLTVGDLEETLISDLACELILGNLIREKQYESILLGDEHELKQFFGELIESKLEVSGFDMLREKAQEDVFSSEKHLNFMFKKIHEMEDLFHSFQELLGSKKLLLKDSYYRKASEVLLEKWQREEKKPWQFIYFAGFTTLRSDFTQILDQILSWGKSAFWTTQAPPLLSQVNPLASLQEKLSAPLQRRVFFSGFDLPNSSQRKIKQAGNALAEVIEAKNLAQFYCDQGVSPSKIGILVSCESTYGSLLRFVFEDQSLKANIAVSLKLSQTIFGSWMMSLVKFLEKGENKNDLIAFLLNPLSFSQLVSFVPEGELSPEKLSRYLLEQKEEKGLKKIASSLSPEKGFDFLPRFFENLFSLIKDFLSRSQDMSLKEWTFVLEKFFKDFRVCDKAFLEAHNISHLVSRAADQFMEALTLAYSCYNPNLRPSDFWELVTKKLLNLEIRNIGYPLEGVQILRLIESRYIPFEVVIVLGCSEGKFPKKLPKDYLLDNWMKKKIGLRGWEYVESLEDTTFHLLKERIPVLELLYSKVEKGRELIPSRFLEIEKALRSVPLEPLEADWSSVFSEKRASLKSKKDQLFSLHSESFFETLSAKSSSFLLTCPFRFLLSSMKVDPHFVFKKREPIEEGKILHRILEIFIKGCFEPELKLSKIKKVLKREEIHSYLTGRLVEISSKLFSVRLSRALLYHLITFSWPRFAQFFSSFYRQNQEGFGELIFDHSYRELNFGAQYSEIETPQVSYFHSGKEVSLNLRGSIDSLDKIGENFLLIDFKRKTIPTQKDQDSLKDIQLLFYTLVHQEAFRSNIEKGLVGYWNILEGTWHPRAMGEEAGEEESFEGKILKKPTLREASERFKGELVTAVSHYQGPSVSFEKRPGKACELCDYKHFCRPLEEGSCHG